MFCSDERKPFLSPRLRRGVDGRPDLGFCNYFTAFLINHDIFVELRKLRFLEHLACVSVTAGKYGLIGCW